MCADTSPGTQMTRMAMISANIYHRKYSSQDETALGPPKAATIEKPADVKDSQGVQKLELSTLLAKNVRM